VCVTSANAQVANTFIATRTGLACPLEDIAPMDCLAFAPKQVTLRSSQSDTFRKHRRDRTLKAR
jgi:hypothetical protein